MSNLEPSSKWHHKESEKTGLSRWLSGRESACDAGDAICLIPGSEDPLEEGMATHSRILAWRISQTEEPGGVQSRGLQRVRHNLMIEHVCARKLKITFVAHLVC